MNPAHYSYSWALTVVHKALEKHARVSEIFLEFTGLTDRQLARLVAEGRPEWPRLRRMLQILDNWERAAPGCTQRYSTFKNLLWDKWHFTDGTLGIYLTGRLNAVEFKSRIQGGAGERSEAK